MTMESGDTLVRSNDILPRLAEEGVTEDAFLDSLQVLEEQYFAEVHRTMGSGIEAASSFQLTTAGMDLYAGTSSMTTRRWSRPSSRSW
jgi:hypothetical protein